jgi:hypothetical protein
VTPGFEKLRSVLGRASTAQRMRGQLIHRITGEATFGSLFVCRFYPQSQHGWFPYFNLIRLLPQTADCLDESPSLKVRKQIYYTNHYLMLSGS